MDETIVNRVIEELMVYKYCFGQNIPAHLVPIAESLSNFSNQELNTLRESWSKDETKFGILDKDNDAFLQSILKQFPFYIYWKDRDLVYRGCNENFAESFQLSLSEMKGKTDFELYDAEKAAYQQKIEEEVIRKGLRKDDLWKESGKDGVTKMVNSITIPLFNEHKEIIGILGFAWGRSEGSLDIQKLRQDAKDYKRRIENSNHIFLEFNQMGYISYVNSAAEDILLFPIERLKDLHIKSLIAKNEQDKFEQMRAGLQERESSQIIYHFRQGNDNFIQLMGSIRLLKNGTYFLELLPNSKAMRQVTTALSCMTREVNLAFKTIDGFNSFLQTKIGDLNTQERVDCKYAMDATIELGRTLKEGQQFMELYEDESPKSKQDLSKLLDAACTIASATMVGYDPEVRCDILPRLNVYGQQMIAFFTKLLEIACKLSSDYREVKIDFLVQEQEQEYNFTVKFHNCKRWKLPKDGDIFKSLYKGEVHAPIPGLGQMLINCDFIIAKHHGKMSSTWEEDESLKMFFALPKN